MQPNSITYVPHDIGMFDPKLVRWANVSALMRQRYGKENMLRLSKEAGVAIASIQRMRDENTSIGIDIVAKVANVFDLLPWQLLFPNLDPKNPPVLGITEAEKRLYSSLRIAAQEIAVYQVKPKTIAS
ncbi:MAG: hypothetical protein ACRDAM_20175 [Casimicrobium sp.]